MVIRTSSYLIAVMALWLISPVAVLAVPLTNPDFEDGLNSWTAEGSVLAEQAPDGNHAAVFREGNGGISRIHQTFTLQGPVNWISFRFRLLTPAAVVSPVPADSFTVYLTDALTGERLVGSGAEPSFTQAILYQDSDGMDISASPWAFADPAPPEDLQIGRIDVSSVTEDREVRFEFAFNHAVNQVSSMVILDDIQLGCPPDYCCSSDLSVVNLIDDGLDCTDDMCNSQTGEVTHQDNGCCPVCYDVAANVVLMIDVTGSINNAELQDEKNAAKAFLQAFEQADPRPYVVIGRFSTSVPGNAEILEPSAWTQDYGDSGDGGGTPTGLYQAIASIQDHEGNTDIATALSVSRAKIQTAPEPDLRKYIVLISDGQPNVPGGSTIPPGCDGPPVLSPQANCPNCLPPPAWCAADLQASEAESIDGISIVAVFFDGGNDPCKRPCAEYFMKHVIATLPPGANPDDNPFFVDTAAGLVCSFNGIVQTISCDDSDPCTIDSCQNGQCVHTPIDSPECGGGAP
ncbi:MAG: VWA domain-containing protein [Phycisphaerales bacterium]|nr:VWA domain-containing protein [Phycisphaerales bacterium]